MSKTYVDIVKEIEELRIEAERLKSAEMSGVIDRIKGAIAAYGLTASDLGLRAKPGPKPGAKPGRKPGRPAGATKSKPGPKPGAAKKAAATGSKSKGVAKFRDANGNTWVGRGPRPQWVRDALLAGKSLKDFAV
jgi:DNA-binding protein H-NS